MNDDTPIDCYEPQFTQSEASDLSGVDMVTLNNWLLPARKIWELKPAKDRKLARRRLFSVADIAALHAMGLFVKLIDLPPKTAKLAATPVYDFFRSANPSVVFSGAPSIADCFPDENGDGMEVCHIFKKEYVGAPDAQSDEGWSVQDVWRDPKSGNLYQYDPRVNTEEEGWLPHFPCILIPTSELALRTFRKCADFLASEGEAE